MSDYQLLDALRPEEYEALKADIRKRGVLVAVEVDEDGTILDGHHRSMIADSLGLDYPKVVRSFDSEAEKIEHVLKINLLRRHLVSGVCPQGVRGLGDPLPRMSHGLIADARVNALRIPRDATGWPRMRERYLNGGLSQNYRLGITHP